MKTPPEIRDIKKWLVNPHTYRAIARMCNGKNCLIGVGVKKNPLGLFGKNKFSVKNIDPKPWSGHFNYLIKVGGKKFVLRLKGPEWGEPTKGILDEYKTLKYVEKYKVGPKAFYLTKNFFSSPRQRRGEPAMLEEYLEGKIFTKFSVRKQEKLFGQIAKFIARLNKITVNKKLVPFQEAMMSYAKNKKAWRRRLKDILKNKKTRKEGLKIKNILPKAERMLDGFEPRLKRVIKKHGPVFIFESAHAGHLLKTKNGFRFFNWEQVSFGDPSYSLAVFLASIQKKTYFERVKEKMIKIYLKENYVPEFKRLVEQRLKEREVSNMIWRIWIKTQRE
ncbi:MAG: phosphotransferase [Candidatus Niyogibacteria bacterium]|nr:MAG: phosphotransferase [Candidatus Niyogibacteria bacterium]